MNFRIGRSVSDCGRIYSVHDTATNQATVHSLHDTDRMAKAIREHECILTFLRAGDETGAVRAFEESICEVTSNHCTQLKP